MSTPHKKMILWPLELRNLDTITVGSGGDRCVISSQEAFKSHNRVLNDQIQKKSVRNSRYQGSTGVWEVSWGICRSVS